MLGTATGVLPRGSSPLMGSLGSRAPSPRARGTARAVERTSSTATVARSGAMAERPVIRIARARSPSCAGPQGSLEQLVGRTGLEQYDQAVPRWPGRNAQRPDTLWALLHVWGDDHDRHLARDLCLIVSSMRRVDEGSRAEHGSSIGGAPRAARPGPVRCTTSVAGLRKENRPGREGGPSPRPQAGPLKALLDETPLLVSNRLAGQLGPRQNVVRICSWPGNGFGFWNTHADASTHLHHRQTVAVYVDAVQLDRA